MCGRIAQSFPNGSLARLIDKSEVMLPRDGRWNVSPGQSVVAVQRGVRGTRHLYHAEWGFVAPWETSAELARIKPINAKAESVATNKLFSSSFKTRRCLVPVRCWYEWKGITSGLKQPYALGRRDGVIVTLGGIISIRRPHRDYPAELSLAIITTPAPAPLSDIHGRAPLIIDEANWSVWLGEKSGDAAELLLSSYVEGIDAWPISRKVNSATIDGPELIEPVVIEASTLAAEGHA